MPEKWTEVKRTSDGLSISTHTERDDGSTGLVDESWYTWSELEAMEGSELLFSSLEE